ncbi:hypothetical protein [Sphingopyxis sp. JAI128]|uniref:hypothetical protein n=1 Tax=Sphingopyxis sp. JAI128 TaxID=2723066 RepID=UPI00161C448E|nr:hypothetical protein [Sphingopyxis sp. JAI128]MBB6425171.1 hypothetical protein [Sphingopyxis sp. JAI128]
MAIHPDILAEMARPPEQPFIWGQGGRRMTPEDIARERALAARQMQSDYSPVQHWSQGLGRVADNVLGALRDRKAQKAADANAADGRRIAELLTQPPSEPGYGQPAASSGIAPVDIPPSSVAPSGSAMLPDVPPSIDQAPPPPEAWRETVAVDPVAAALITGTEQENQIARALMARPQNGAVPTQMYRPSDAIIEALTNPYLDQNIRSFADRLWQQEFEQSKPQFFMSGEDRVSYNPVSGESQVLYDAPEDFQLYADQMGFEPGTDEYNDAMADYVLRTAGPTANDGRQFLENLRQQNRLSMEGERQKNRLQLRQTPTYLQANPRPSGGSRGGRGKPTIAGVIAPILGKVSQGQPLTAGEQQALDTYYRRTGKPRSGGTAGGQVIRNPKTGEKMTLRNGQWVPVQ